MSILAELKRRRIFRVAVAYLVAATALIAVVVDVSPSLPFEANVQETIRDVVIYGIAVGFPLALVLSWLFDWTPQGIVRDTGGGASGSSRALAAKSVNRTLRELISSGPLSVSRLLRLGVRLTDRVARQHANGVAHGGLNPEIVLVTADDHVELSETANPASVTSSEAVERSAYLAPECARGAPPDLRSDQFSLGAILYEMATGRRAFAGSNLDETLAAVMHADPEPAARFNAELPMPLQWVLDRCLAKRQEDRYAGMSELHHDLAAIAASVTAVMSVRHAPKHNLPAQRTPLIGREAELAEVEQLVLDPAIRLLTVTGAGGIGKTRMLVETGHQLLASFPGGVFFVPLDRIHDPELVRSEVAKSLGVQQLSDRSLDEVLTSHVRQHCIAPTLLLVDNFEHVLTAAPTLSNVLEASGQIKIVVTSRAALRVYGEHEYRLAPLLVADRNASPEQLCESPAVRLFLARASTLDDPDEDAVRIVAEICERLDGLPLAIELAAARTRMLPLKGLRERIKEPLDFLSGGPRDLPARQRTLRATLQWSYELLDQSLQKLFRRIGVFVGGATLEAIEAVCNVDEDLDVNLWEAVETLVDNSLIRPMDSDAIEPRFAMLETMREFALLQLAEAGEEARTRKAHAAYSLVLAGEWSQAQAAGRWQALYDRFDRESGNLRAALDWLIETRDEDWGLRLASSLCHYWLQRGHAKEGYEWMLQLISLAEPDSEQLIWAFAWAGDLTALMDRPDEAYDYHSGSAELARKLGNVPGIIRGLNAMAVNKQHLGELEAAASIHEEAVTLARQHGGSPAVLGGMLSNLADNEMNRGKLDQAERLHEETLQLFVNAGDEAAVAWSLNRLGDVARRRGDAEAASRQYEAALSKFRMLGDKRGAAACLFDMADLQVETDCAHSEKLNSEVLSIYREQNLIADYPRVLEALARCAHRSGEPARAMTLAGGAAAMRQAFSQPLKDAAREAVERCIDAARQSLTDSEATDHWMKGWAMPPGDAVAFALRERDESRPDGI